LKKAGCGSAGKWRAHSGMVLKTQVAITAFTRQWYRLINYRFTPIIYLL